MRKEFFYSDKSLQEKLSLIPRGERSCIIRMALRDYFQLTDSKNGKVGYSKETIDDIKTAINCHEECFECRREFSSKERPCDTCEDKEV